MKVVLLARMAPERVAEIASVDPRLDVEHAWEQFAPELVAEWPEQTVGGYLPPSFREIADNVELRQRRDELLASAEVICISFPFPKRLVTRAPRLRFVHQMAAGVSNLMPGDPWRTHVPVTSGRGAGNVAPIAEWTMAAILALSKEYPRAFAQRTAGRFDRRSFHGRQVAGTTLGVIGLGGIGRHVARLARGLGMRALGLRRSSEPVEHIDRLYAPPELHALLSQCDHVVIAAQYTDETYHLLDEPAFAAMKPGAFLVNVARGELIDESALIAALQSGHLGGFAADVYEGEFDHPPRPELMTLDNVILTPHSSGQSQQRSAGSLEILKENLRRCLAGQPLLNQVDWARGY